MIQDISRVISIPVWVMRIVNAFAHHDFQCYIVGGAVRDQLHGKSVYDYDLATDATPQQIKRLWKRTVSTGEKYGTVTLLAGDKHAEVTSFRSEANYTDSRHPEEVRFGTDIATDLLRRDFTINAIAYHPIDETFVDLFGGMDDIRRKIIRAVGDPEERFTEDALRMLRAVRFATTLQFAIEPQTERAILRCGDRIRAVSAERIREELERIIRSPHCREGFRLLARLRLLSRVYAIGSLAEGLAQEGKLRGVVDTHLGRVRELPPTALHLRHTLLWYALLRAQTQNNAADTASTDERLLTDARLLTDLATQLRALRYPQAHAQGVMHLVRMLRQLPSPNSSEGSIRYFFVTVGKAYRVDMRALLLVLHTLGEGDQAHGRRLIAVMDRQKVFGHQDLAIDGNDLQSIGYKPSRRIGEFMRHAVEHVCEHPSDNTRQTLTERARSFLRANA